LAGGASGAWGSPVAAWRRPLEPVFRRAGHSVRPSHGRASSSSARGKSRGDQAVTAISRARSSTAVAMATAAGARVLARGRTTPAFSNWARGGGVDFLHTKASSRGRVAVWPGYGGVWAATYDARRANSVRWHRQPAHEDGTRGTDPRLETASTVPCHSDQGITHGPAVGGEPRRAGVLRRVGVP
jgi:hypothetical protein